MSRFVLALDQGTTSSRAILFDKAGRPLAASQLELIQHYPKPGWVEHDPEEIWTGQIAAMRHAMQKIDAVVADCAAIGIANQRETTVVWNRETGLAIHPAIVWQDRRTADRCLQLQSAGFEEFVCARTGLLIDSYFSATKLEWLLDNVPGARADAEAGLLAFGTIDSYLMWRLTGERVHATDVSNASRTMLFDIHKGEWCEDLLKLFNVPRSVLPQVVDSSGIVGHTDVSLFGREIPIAGIAGDQQAAMFGQACVHQGMAKSTYGTGCFLLMHTGSEAKASSNRLLTTVAAGTMKSPEYALEGSVFIAGAAVQWLRDKMKFFRTSAEIEGLANEAEDSQGVYMVPAFTGLGAPYWDSQARGAIVGLTRGSGIAQIARATLESIAYQCRDVLDAMGRDLGAPITEIRVDGGACENDTLMQFQADILDIPVTRPSCVETTAMGAANLAGLAVGFWNSRAEIETMWQIDRTFEPTMSSGRREALYSGWQEAVSRVRT